MAENGIFIAENLLAMSSPSFTTPDAGYAGINVVDNFHYTFWKWSNVDTNGNFFMNAASSPVVDCAVVDSDFIDPAGHLQVWNYTAPSTYVMMGEAVGIVKGANLIICAPFSQSTFAYIRINSAANPKIIRHAWMGVQLPIMSPLAPFDPEAVEQPQQQFFGRTGMMAKNSPLYTKKVLDMSFKNIPDADYTTLLALYNKAYVKSLPFWYFHKPVTQPKNGYLYEFDMEGFQMPFTLGNYRTAQIKAKANWSPDRSTATL